MKLFVDDIRKPPDGWHLASTNTEAIRLLAGGHVVEISLDHDIVALKRIDGFLSDRIGTETFEPIAYYLAEMEQRPKVRFHTANLTGGRRMAEIIGCEFDYWWMENQ